VEKIQNQTEIEIEILQMRYQENEIRNENDRVKITELKQQISETNIEKAKAETSFCSAREALSKIREARGEAQDEWEKYSSVRENERLEYKGRVNSLLAKLKELRDSEEPQREQSFSDLNSKLVEKETEIQRLIEENINQIETHTKLTENIRDYHSDKDSVSLRRQKTLDFSVPPEKLKEQLRNTQEENEHLKIYIDKVLNQIMEQCSHLLEVKK